MGSLNPGVSAAGRLRVQEFRSSGTWTNPGTKTVGLFLVGGGGGGNGSQPGQGGNVVELNYDVDGKSSCVVVVGAGGASGASGHGGETSFDGTAKAQGGMAGSGLSPGTIMAVVTGRNGFGGNGSIGVTNAPFVNGAKNGDGGTNTGAGGASSSAGGSGYVRVEWYE